MQKKLAKIRKFLFNDNSYVIFEEFDTLSGRCLFTDVYYKDNNGSAYLGSFNDLDKSNIYVKKSNQYIMIYEYMIDQNINNIDHQVITKILQFYHTKEDIDIYDKYIKLIEMFNNNLDEPVVLMKNLENKKLSTINRRKFLTLRKNEIYNNIVSYEIIEEDKIKEFNNIDREEYNHPIKGIYPKQKVK